MTYCSQQNLVDRYGTDMLVSLTDRALPPANTIDAAVVARALADTDALINGYLQGRYQLPLAATPELLTDIAQAVAIYKLHRGLTDDKVKRDYDDALKQLREIASGAIRLNVAGVEPQGAAGADGIRVSQPTRPFGGGPMDGLI